VTHLTDPPSGPLTAHTIDELRERRSAKWQQYPPDVLPMWVAEMDTPLAEPIAAALMNAVGRGDTGYAVAGGLPEAFAGFAGRRYGWWPDPADMRLVPDVMAGIVEVLRVVTEPGDRVVVNTPAYPPYFFWLPRIGREMVQSPLAAGPDGPRLDLDRLERDFAAGAAAYLLCSPHNPTGLVFDRAELLAVAGLADRYGVRVVVDDIHAPLTFPEARYIPFGSLDAPAAGRSITLTSASKAWNLAGLKAALAVPSPEARSDVAALHAGISEAAGLLGVIASEAAFSAGEPWLAELMEGLDANRSLLGRLLRDQLPDVGYRPPAATYLAWLDCHALGLGDDPAEVFLERGRVALHRGPEFGSAGRGFARLNLATAPERIVEAVKRMAASCGPAN
jgi:cystathionine beta-lyase